MSSNNQRSVEDLCEKVTKTWSDTVGRAEATISISQEALAMKRDAEEEATRTNAVRGDEGFLSMPDTHSKLLKALKNAKRTIYGFLLSHNPDEAERTASEMTDASDVAFGSVIALRGRMSTSSDTNREENRTTGGDMGGGLAVPGKLRDGWFWRTDNEIGFKDLRSSHCLPKETARLRAEYESICV